MAAIAGLRLGSYPSRPPPPSSWPGLTRPSTPRRRRNEPAPTTAGGDNPRTTGEAQMAGSVAGHDDEGAARTDHDARPGHDDAGAARSDHGARPGHHGNNSRGEKHGAQS